MPKAEHTRDNPLGVINLSLENSLFAILAVFVTLSHKIEHMEVE